MTDIEIVIDPPAGFASLNLRELWHTRELFAFLVWRDIKVRYKQTILGGAWAIIQPVGATVVFTVFFGHLAHIPSEGVAYPLFSYVGLMPWTFFANAQAAAATSMVANSQLVSKVYFPRLVIPVAAVLAFGVDFLISVIVLIGMMIYYSATPPVSGVVWIPVSMLLMLVATLGSGLLLAGLNVYFRDIKYVQPFLIQFWLFATPVVYPTSQIHSSTWRVIYGVNPMAGAVETFRWGVFGKGVPPGSMLLVSAASAVVVGLAGLVLFGRLERSFADVV